ncbi:MAG: efflux RND transporter periplasmic adaptor subunit [Gammaproteobacteria bacterium]|nr:efflux RND transporter periplasmic adaptor subunit [Gammaproteobacteria bacterium]
MPVLVATAPTQGRCVKIYKFQLLSLFSALVFLSACGEKSEQTTENIHTDQIIKESAVKHATKHLETRYVCPMHPKIFKSEPGQTCPICGMDLVEKKIDLGAGAYPVIKLTPDIVQKMGVRTTTVEKGQLWKFIKTVGYVSYNERRVKTVSVRTEGWVENLSVRRVGLPVRKGQLLLELYSPEFLQVQKDFIEAQKKDKSGILRKYGDRKESVRPRDHLRYMHVAESLMNEIARKKKPKYRLPVYAPMHGTIVRHNIHKHKYVYNDFPMLVIADLSTVWVEANVYEHQLEWIKRNLSAEIDVKALPGQRFTGHISYIYPELDPKTRTLRVRLLVPNPDQLLKPNMFAEVRIFGGPKKDLLKIPREALIVTGERESVVMDLGNGKYQPVDVVAGMHSHDEVEIISGLKENDRIVSSGQFLIDSEANLQASFSRMNSESATE